MEKVDINKNKLEVEQSILSEEEKLVQALISIRQILNEIGLNEINNTVECKDGTKETFDCMKVIEEHIVNYFKCNLHIKE